MTDQTRPVVLPTPETIEQKALFAAKCLVEGRCVMVSDDAVFAMAQYIMGLR